MNPQTLSAVERRNDNRLLESAKFMKIQQNMRYNKTCAVVFSSIFTRPYGTLIDAHDLIFRFNMAPVKRFETTVGRRTTHMTLHNVRSHSHPVSPLMRWMDFVRRHPSDIQAVTFANVSIPNVIALRDNCKIKSKQCSSGFHLVHYLLKHSHTFTCKHITVIGSDGKYLRDNASFHYYNIALDNKKNVFTPNYRSFHAFDAEAMQLGKWATEKNITLFF